MTYDRLVHEFVKFVPKQLDGGTLYVSVPYATAVHLCACGCGNKVVTPISPARWQLTFDGESASLSPSIGNWAFPCRSHYWIKGGSVRWAAEWSDAQIRAGRARDALDLKTYATSRASADTPVPSALAPPVKPRSWRRFRNWIK